MGTGISHGEDELQNNRLQVNSETCINSFFLKDFFYFLYYINICSLSKTTQKKYKIRQK